MRGAAVEAAMPLMYLPLIMYASWMEFLAQPFKAMHLGNLDAPARQRSAAPDTWSTTRPTG
jgi:hypothetical protein